jgi:hypothetical protein
MVLPHLPPGEWNRIFARLAVGWIVASGLIYGALWAFLKRTGVLPGALFLPVGLIISLPGPVVLFIAIDKIWKAYDARSHGNRVIVSCSTRSNSQYDDRSEVCSKRYDSLNDRSKAVKMKPGLLNDSVQNWRKESQSQDSEPHSAQSHFTKCREKSTRLE